MPTEALVRCCCCSPPPTAHYDKIAEKFDEFYDDFWLEPLADLAVKYLDLQPGDKIADVGAGTGRMAHKIWKKAGLQTPVLAVDPNQKLLQIAQGKEGVESLLATVDEFVARPEFSKYNKILMCHCAHHFPDPTATFKAMLQRMPADGKCVIIYYHKEIHLTLWNTVRESFSKATRDLSKHMAEAGLAVEVYREVVSYHVTKSFWYKWLRGRAISFFEQLSDEEIDQGIAELEKTQLAGIGLEDVIEIKDTHMVALATPPQVKIEP